MGHKKIWDGKNLPERGDLVLIHLSSNKVYVPHKLSHDARSSSNTRNLEQCFALDTDPLDLPVDGCLKTPREAQAAKAGAK